jgi:hypothetical protein
VLALLAAWQPRQIQADTNFFILLRMEARPQRQLRRNFSTGATSVPPRITPAVGLRTEMGWRSLRFAT